MHIVHVSRQYAPAVGGMETVVEQLARSQQRAGHHVKVVTLDRLFGSRAMIVPSRDTLDGVDVVRVGFLGPERYPLAFGILPHLKGADVVHVHGIDFFFDFLAATRPLHRRKLIATTHGGFFHTPRAGALKRLWFRSITRASARAYDFLVACSDHDQALFTPLSHAGLQLIENGVDTEKYRDVASRDAKSVLYFGRWAPNKGLDRLLGWFAAIRAVDADWTLTIAGRPAGVTPEALRAQARALGIGHAVRVVPNPEDFRLRRLMAEASVFASASSYEGFGIAAIEAASAGLMPVLSRIVPFEQVVGRLGDGYLTEFEPERHEARRFLAAWRDWSTDRRDALMHAASAEYGWGRAARASASLHQALHPPVRHVSGINVIATSRADALARIGERIESRAPALVAFCNAHTGNLARNDPSLARVLAGAMVLNDGAGLDLASRWLFGCPFPENLNGTDLVPALLRDAERPLRLFLLGSKPGVAEAAARRIAADYPRHLVVGVQHGYFADRESARVVADIREAAPDVVLIGMGQPRQELWAAAHLASVPTVAMCVGAFLDFAAGAVPRAPALIRKWRLEWCYRLAREPRRLAGRYLIGNFSFLAAVARQSRRVPWSPRSALRSHGGTSPEVVTAHATRETAIRA